MTPIPTVTLVRIKCCANGGSCSEIVGKVVAERKAEPFVSLLTPGGQSDTPGIPARLERPQVPMSEVGGTLSAWCPRHGRRAVDADRLVAALEVAINKNKATWAYCRDAR